MQLAQNKSYLLQLVDDKWRLLTEVTEDKTAQHQQVCAKLLQYIADSETTKLHLNNIIRPLMIQRVANATTTPDAEDEHDNDENDDEEASEEDILSLASQLSDEAQSSDDEGQGAWAMCT